MAAPDMPALIDQLGAASLEARQLLADIRGATRDLRNAIRDAQAEREQLADLIKRTVADDIQAEVSTQLAKLGEQTQAAMAAATAKVGREFDRLTNIMMTGDDYARPAKGALDLRELAREQHQRRTLGGAP